MPSPILLTVGGGAAASRRAVICGTVGVISNRPVPFLRLVPHSMWCAARRRVAAIPRGGVEFLCGGKMFGGALSASAHAVGSGIAGCEVRDQRPPLASFESRVCRRRQRIASVGWGGIRLSPPTRLQTGAAVTACGGAAFDAARDDGLSGPAGRTPRDSGLHAADRGVRHSRETCEIRLGRHPRLMNVDEVGLPNPAAMPRDRLVSDGCGR